VELLMIVRTFLFFLWIKWTQLATLWRKKILN
jgi:hypothetical protein